MSGYVSRCRYMHGGVHHKLVELGSVNHNIVRFHLALQVLLDLNMLALHVVDGSDRCAQNKLM